MLPRCLLLTVLAMALALPPWPASAIGGACTSDGDCAPPGRNRTASCQGSVLVTRDHLCLGGRCSDSVVRRIECGGAGIGTGNCDPIAGQCRGTGGGASVSKLCPPRCLCRGDTLIVVTGRRGKATRCETQVTQCANGCTCSPAPRCNPPARQRG